MKTNEFKNLLSMYGLEVVEETNLVLILKHDVCAANVSVSHVECYDTNFREMRNFCIPERKEIVAIIKEYAETDVEARKDEKMARLRLDVPLVEYPYYWFRNKITGKGGVSVLLPSDENIQYEFAADELLGLNRTGFKVEVLG